MKLVHVSSAISGAICEGSIILDVFILVPLMRLQTSEALDFDSSAKVIGIWSFPTPWLCEEVRQLMASAEVKTCSWPSSRTWASQSLLQEALCVEQRDAAVDRFAMSVTKACLRTGS